MTREVLLGGYPAKECAVRTHNKFLPDGPEPQPVDAATQQRMDDGNAFEEHVFALLAAELGDDFLLIEQEVVADKQRRIDETMAAINAGVFVIAGGQFADVPDTGRTGCPDLLLRAGRLSGQWRYFPVDVKHHQTLAFGKSEKTTARVSSFADPLNSVERTGVSDRATNRRKDAMQLAHYTRMLQDLGLHPGERHLRGAIIGTSDLSGLGFGRYGLTWLDLTEQKEETWSASTGKKKRSILECYDFEFAHRLRVADVARQQDQPDAPEPLVRPFGKKECSGCPFQTHCRDTAGPTDPSFVISKGQLTDREWAYLYDQGFGTIGALADLDPVGPLLDGYLAAASDQRTPEKRLADIIRRARMHRDGIVLERITEGPLDIPSADVEIDFDIEWDTDGRVYLWGVWVHRRHDDQAEYWPCHDFTPMNDESAQALADQFFTWLTGFVADIEASGHSVMIYHWCPPEQTHSRRAWARAEELFAGRTCDLQKVVKEHFFDRDGLSVKTIAPLFGFAWTASNAGGAESMNMIDDARSGNADAAKWLLGYNRDDVRSTAVVRAGLRALGDERVVLDPGAIKEAVDPTTPDILDIIKGLADEELDASALLARNFHDRPAMNAPASPTTETSATDATCGESPPEQPDGVTAAEPDVDDLPDEVNEYIEALEDEVDELRAKATEVSEALARSDERVSSLQAQLRRASQEKDMAEAALEDERIDSAALREQVDGLQDSLSRAMSESRNLQLRLDRTEALTVHGEVERHRLMREAAEELLRDERTKNEALTGELAAARSQFMVELHERVFGDATGHDDDDEVFEDAIDEVDDYLTALRANRAN